LVLVRYWNVAVRLGYFVIVSLALSRLRIAFERERAFARLDPTTGIANGRAFAELAGAEIERARRYHHPLTIAYLDLDNFKTVNDRFGHGTGDRVLSTVGRTLQERARTTDIVARPGGDEFAILMPEAGADAAQALLTRIQSALAETMRQNGWPVTFSIGSVTFSAPPENVEKLIEKADALMYSVKSSGKNRIETLVFKG
jgi:diguanylate cyclase (GGDEF)-like protein